MQLRTHRPNDVNDHMTWSYQFSIIQTQTHHSAPAAWQLHRRAELQDKANPAWLQKQEDLPAAKHPIKHAPRCQQLGSTNLLCQLDHVEIPGAQTVVGVDSPVGHVVSSDVSASVTRRARVKMCMYSPPQLKVLVHQLGQSAPVLFLESRPEGGQHVLTFRKTAPTKTTGTELS